MHTGIAQPTRGQKAIEYVLFVVFGLTIALAAVALYATTRPEHQRVPNRVDIGVKSDRVNVLVIGASVNTKATSASSSIRTESLMLLSVQPSTGRAALTAIPVDLWVKVGRYGNRPLRAAYMVGEASGYPGAGTGLTVDTVADIVDEPIHGYVRMSIGDVKRIVDSIGGIDVTVQRGVYDFRTGDRFRRGSRHFDGAEAIRYAYSRSIAGSAAGRFEREDRQQEVAVAALTKIFNSDGDEAGLARAFGNVTATNLSRDQIAMLSHALRRGGEVRRVSFAPLLDEVDVTSIAYRGEAVSPRDGDFAALRKLTDAVFDTGVARVH